MKFGMSMLLWTPTVTEEHIPLLQKLGGWGYDGVEVPANELDDAHYEMLGKAFRDAGLEPVGVGVAMPDSSPSSPVPAVREAALQRLQRQTDRAAAMGSKWLVGPLHSGYAEFSGKGPQGDELKHSAETLHAAAEDAQSKGVKIAVEFLNRFECYLVTTAAETDALVRLADHPNLCTLYDTHHAHIEERSQADAIRACANTLGHVQLSENHRGVPGTGQVDWRGAFGAFREVGYDGWFVIESFSRIDPVWAGMLHIWRDFADSADEVCVEGLKFVKRAWEESAASA